jgi:death on curing protein
MKAFLILNGFELSASVDDQEAIILKLASGELSRESLGVWLGENATSI